MASVDELIANWGSHKAGLRCEEVIAGLKSLGFDVRTGRTEGHKKYSHPSLPDFYGSSWNCGHGKNPTILSSYIGNIIKVLKKYRDDLESLNIGVKND
jgi:hypothetical protein